MSKIMLINMTHAEESRVGIIADGVLASFEIESFSREHLKGNIYKGVVHRIHPALEAAFVDIGADRDAFLPLDEICFRNLPEAPRESGNGGEGRRRMRIKEILKPGQELLVQIVKEEFANKPPTLSTFYSLPGRYLVLLPGSDEAGISRKIEGDERSRIRELVEKLQPPEGFGIIIRTAAGFDEGSRELHRDLNYLLRLWDTIRQTAATKGAPALVYREHDLVLRNIRDYFTPDIDEIYVDNEEVFQRAREFLRDVMPGKENVLHLYEGDKPIFSHFNVESQIESIYKRRVPLKSGGSIVIDGTEALTAIDVNSGRSVRGSSQEDTAYRTNIEAASEIARQLRLRDLGGLIVIDFIDMRNAAHISEVERTLRDAMRQDKARHELGRISHFGLLEISRQRLRPAAAATSYTACPMCEGHGLVRTTESAALVALRKIHNRVAQGDVAILRVSLPPDVAVYLLNQKRDDLAQLERRYATRIQVALKSDLMPHESELEVRSRLEAGQAKVPQIRLGGVAAPDVAATSGIDTGADNNGAAVSAPGPTSVPSSAGAASGASATGATAERAGGGPAATGADSGGEAPQPGKRRRRRRGRRRGRGRQAAAAIGEALAALGAQTSLGQGASDAEASAFDGDGDGAPQPGVIAARGAAVELQGDRAERPADAGEEAASDVEATLLQSEEAVTAPAPKRSRRSRAGVSRRGGRGRKKKAADKPAAVAAETPGPSESKDQTPRSRTPRKRSSSQRSRRPRGKGSRATRPQVAAQAKPEEIS